LRSSSTRELLSGDSQNPYLLPHSSHYEKQFLSKVSEFGTDEAPEASAKANGYCPLGKKAWSHTFYYSDE